MAADTAVRKVLADDRLGRDVQFVRNGVALAPQRVLIRWSQGVPSDAGPIAQTARLLTIIGYDDMDLQAGDRAFLTPENEWLVVTDVNPMRYAATRAFARAYSE